MNARFSLPALALVAVLGATPGESAGQALRLTTLQVPPDAAPGPWVSYRVRTQSRSLPPRELTQRAALVSAEGIGEEAGVWVELKTVDPQTGTRIDRGFYGRPPGGEKADAGAPRLLTLRRVQRLHPDGRLYEYPPNSNAVLRGDEEVSTLGLIETSAARPPRVDTLGVDTLRIGRRTLPGIIIRKQWLGDDEWSEGENTQFVNRVLLTLTEHVCPEVPLTGFTKSSYQVTTAQFAVADSLRQHPIAPADSTGAPVVYRAELTLGDMGTGAVPEVTQEPEPAPEAEVPAGRPDVTH